MESGPVPHEANRGFDRATDWRIMFAGKGGLTGQCVCFSGVQIVQLTLNRYSVVARDLLINARDLAERIGDEHTAKIASATVAEIEQTGSLRADMLMQLLSDA